MEEVKLERNTKVFQLADGKHLIISNEDYKELVASITAEMLVNKDNQIYLIKDAALERAKLLQKVYNDNKDDMIVKTKNRYMQEIIDILTKNDYDIITFKQYKEEQND